jgi:FHS family L-fucose permease-like MFS transporter
VEDDYHLDEADPNVSHSIWAHPHFVMAVAAQFFYVAAQAGIFSFFINYMTTQVPPIPASLRDGMENFASHMGFMHNWLSGWFELNKAGVLSISDKGASNLASVGFVCFLLGRCTGSLILKVRSAHGVLGLYALINVAVCGLIFCKLGWISAVCVFLSYFFMSIMFPTIFALGIFGLGARAKRASSFIVMAIMGGAILPKLMGFVADKFDMSRGFIVPMVCFVAVAFYGYRWPSFSKAESLDTVKVSAGH